MASSTCRADIIWGDIDQTVDGFTSLLEPSSPIGFISIDVDTYSGSKAALRCLTGSPSTCLPAVSMYFDDISFFFANRWCGELAAASEFNDTSESRKIDIDRSLPGRRNAKAESWYQNMHVCSCPRSSRAAEVIEQTAADDRRALQLHEGAVSLLAIRDVATVQSLTVCRRATAGTASAAPSGHPKEAAERIKNPIYSIR